MYEPPELLRLAPRQLDLSAGAGEMTLAEALSRARKVFDGFTPGLALAPAALRRALRRPAAAPALERERLFVLGWLAWADGNAAAAESVLADAESRCLAAAGDEAPSGELSPLEPVQLLARITYWLARVRLLVERADALTHYEGALRRLSGWPPATAWYVDLLWRAGRVDRAEQVWKSVRGNKRVAAADEAPLLDARVHLRKGELAPAERLLREAETSGGVTWVERHLLLAWALAGPRQGERAREALDRAALGPYPAAALAAWRRAIDSRQQGAALAIDAPSLFRSFLAGQEARGAGQVEEAERAYREAAGVALVQPFARYGLVCLGKDDPAALLTATPGLFLALRCRARQAVARFARREIGPGELLEAIQQAASAGYQAPDLDHYRRLARALQQRDVGPDDLAALVAGEGAERGNAFRIAIELSARQSAADAGRLLAEWAEEPSLQESDLRLAHASASRRAALQLDGPEALALEESPPASTLHQAAAALAASGGLDEASRARLREMVQEQRYGGLARALLLHDGACRNDPVAVAEQLDALDAWRGLRPLPRFVVRALAAIVAAHPTHVAWRQSLARWLELWPGAQLGPEGATLTAAAGKAPAAEEALVPAGVDPGAWLLHQASRALLRDAPREALAFVRRAGVALPALERLADAAALTALPGAPANPAVLTGLVEELRALPGAPLPDSAELPEWLCQQPSESLPPRLHHHLALLATREATRRERGEPAEAAEVWRRAWGHWLALLASDAAPETGVSEALLDHLLGRLRQRLNELLRQGEVEPARRYMALVRQLPDLAGPKWRDDLTGRIERFRDELATEHLLATREAMRYGDIPEGWRADYERGLTALRRLMALDRDNVRLLTAVVETCGEWFLDLYNTQDLERLRQEVERYAPLGTHLLRLIGTQSGEHPARPALSELYKFRGFVEADPTSRIAHYREALRLNPRNDNVRDLLEQLGVDPPGENDER